MWQNVILSTVTSRNDTKYYSLKVGQTAHRWQGITVVRWGGVGWGALGLTSNWQYSALVLLLLFYDCCVLIFLLVRLIETACTFSFNCHVQTWQVGFRMSFHVRLFADEAEVETWCGCVCWLRGWGLIKTAVPSLWPSCLSNTFHTCLLCPCVIIRSLFCSSLCDLFNSSFTFT